MKLTFSKILKQSEAFLSIILPPYNWQRFSLKNSNKNRITPSSNAKIDVDICHDETSDLKMCTQCVSDPTHSLWIVEHGHEGNCDFSETHGKQNHVVTVEEFSKYFDNFFREHYVPGGDFVYAIEESDNPQHGTLGSGLEELIGDELEAEEDVTSAVIACLEQENVDVSSGEEPFYLPFANYEHINDVKSRHDAAMSDYYDYMYEVDANLTTETVFDVLQKNLSLLERLLDEKDLMQNDLQRFQLMMVFSFSITVFETFLSDLFTLKVMNDSGLKVKYLKTEKKFSEQKFGLATIFEELKGLDTKIQQEILETTFHNLKRAKGLYKDVLDIEFGNELGDLFTMIRKRHDFVHRCGRDKEGQDVLTNKEETKKLISLVRVLCKSIFEQSDAIALNVA